MVRLLLIWTYIIIVGKGDIQPPLAVLLRGVFSLEQNPKIDELAQDSRSQASRIMT